MNSKTSLFSKALVKSDIKRYWWVSVIYIVLTALFILPNAVMKDIGDVYSRFDSDNGALALFFAFALGGLLFSYLHRVNSVSFMNSIPVSRTTQYLSHILSGFILLIVPITVTSLVIFFEELHYGSGIQFCYKYFYTCLLYSACAFMLTTFTSVLSGNLISTYVFGGGFVALPYFILSMANEIFSKNVYGFVDYDEGIMQYIYIMGIDEMWAKRSVIYITIAVALFIISLVLYKLRNMENYGEVVAFKSLKPILMYFVAVCFGLFGYDSLYYIHNRSLNFTLGVLPLGVVALIAVFMLNQKSFSFKGILKPIVIFAVCMGIVNVIFAFDLTGYERRVPSENNVVSIDAFDYMGHISYDSGYTNGSPDYDKVRYKGIITDKKDIDTMVKLHKYLVQRGDVSNKSNNMTYITMHYTLNHNRKLSRGYFLSPEEMKSIYTIDNYKKATYPIVNDNKKEMNYVQITDPRLLNYSQRLNNIDIDKLADIVKKDIMELTPEDFEVINSDKDNYSSLDINYTEYVVYKGKTYKYGISQNIPLSSCFKDVVDYLQQQGYTSNYIPIDSINSLDVDYSALDDQNDDYTGAETAVSELDTKNNVQISDKNDIKAIMEALYNLNYKDPDDKNTALYRLSIFSTDLKSNGNDGYITVTLPSNEISPALKKYFKK